MEKVKNSNGSSFDDKNFTDNCANILSTNISYQFAYDQFESNHNSNKMLSLLKLSTGRERLTLRNRYKALKERYISTGLSIRKTVMSKVCNQCDIIKAGYRNTKDALNQSLTIAQLLLEEIQKIERNKPLL